MSITVIDDCLNADAFENIKNTLMGANFPWYYNAFKVEKEDSLDSLHNYQFTHMFYKSFAPASQHISLLDPLLVALNPAAIVRIKSNLTPRTEEIVEYRLHIDEPGFNGTTAIYYVNNNNGYTRFSDGTIVESKENRLVTFDSNIYHTGTTCTDQKVRCVINFNYYSKTNLGIL